MKTILFILAVLTAVVLFQSCDEDEQDIWDYSDFEETVNQDDTSLFLDEAISTQYAYFKLQLALSDKIYNAEDGLNYIIEYDSVVLLANGKRIDIDYSINNDTLALLNTEGISEACDGELTLWGSWYYKDSRTTQYTNGNPVFIETINQTMIIPSSGKLPFSSNIVFIESENEGSAYYVPSISLEKELGTIFTNQELNYKYELEGTMVSSSKTTDLVFESNDNQNFQLNYEGNLSDAENYTFKVIANWYIQDNDDNWIKCEGFEETFDKEINTNDSDIPDISYESFETVYPLYRQCNLLIDEYNKGYLIPDDLTALKYLSNNSIKVVIKATNAEDSITSTLNYNETDNILTYDLSVDQLNLATIYSITFYNADSGDQIFKYHFRTSMYRSFNEKFESEQLLGINTYDNSWKTTFIKNYFYSPLFCFNINPISEGLDTYEGVWTDDTIQLIQCTTDQFPEIMNGTIEKAIYSASSLNIQRDSSFSQFDMPPYNALYFYAINKLLTNDDIESNDIEFSGYTFRYYGCVVAVLDYGSVYYEAQELFPDLISITSKTDTVYKIKLPPIDISYVLPGINLTTSKIEGWEIPGWEE